MVLPMVVRVLRLKMRVNWAFSSGRVREANAGCLMVVHGLSGTGALPMGSRVDVRLDREHAISPNTIL